MKRSIVITLVIMIVITFLFDIRTGHSCQIIPAQVHQATHIIANATNTDQIGQYPADWSKYFKLTADINLSGYKGILFHRIGYDATISSASVFDGNGNTISGFTYTARSTNYIGVFGNISDAGIVKNVSLVDVNVIGNQYVGGLVGYNDGSISNCYSTGSVSGSSSDAGGLVGV